MSITTFSILYLVSGLLITLDWTKQAKALGAYRPVPDLIGEAIGFLLVAIGWPIMLVWRLTH